MVVLQLTDALDPVRAELVEPQHAGIRVVHDRIGARARGDALLLYLRVANPVKPLPATAIDGVERCTRGAERRGVDALHERVLGDDARHERVDR